MLLQLDFRYVLQSMLYSYSAVWVGRVRVIDGPKESRPLKTIAIVSIPNFKFLIQFGGGLCEERTQKMRKNDKKTTHFGDAGMKGSYQFCTVF